MESALKIIAIFECILLAYLGLAALYFLVFALASRFYREETVKLSKINGRVAILIPSYREDSVIVETARSAMCHKSLSSVLDVLVIADSLKPETMEAIRDTGAQVLPVSFRKSTKSKAIQQGLSVLSPDCDYVIILDADNRMEEGFVDQILAVARQGFRVVQGHRTAKNNNTPLALLDGISEEVNNAIFRKGHRVLGLSASLIGSGFVIESDLLKELMLQARAVGGFDKELELMLLEQKIRIAYASKATLYDEKIQEAEAFVNQRRRWLSAQFTYLGNNLKKGWIQAVRYGNLDYLDKLFQFLLPPRMITLGLTFLFSMLHVLWMMVNRSVAGGMETAWFTVLGITILALIASIPFRQYGTSIYRSLLYLPSGFLLILKALFKVRGANKSFIHTRHTGD